MSHCRRDPVLTTPVTTDGWGQRSRRSRVRKPDRSRRFQARLRMVRFGSDKVGCSGVPSRHGISCKGWAGSANWGRVLAPPRPWFLLQVFILTNRYNLLSVMSIRLGDPRPTKHIRTCRFRLQLFPARSQPGLRSVRHQPGTKQPCEGSSSCTTPHVNPQCIISVDDTILEAQPGIATRCTPLSGRIRFAAAGPICEDQAGCVIELLEHHGA